MQMAQVPIQINGWVQPPNNNCDRCFAFCFSLQNRKKIAIITSLMALATDACGWPHFGYKSLVNDTYRLFFSYFTLVSIAATISLLFPLPAPIEGRQSLEPIQFGYTRAVTSLFTGLGTLIVYANTTEEERNHTDYIYWGMPAICFLALPEMLLRLYANRLPRN